MTKIMLVEDDNNLREIYEARLLAEGYEIVSAKDGEEALAMAVKEKPDLIISDIMMPKISGFDMLDILRSTPETKNTKVIMMTALSQTEDKARADKLGADRYLVKSQVTLEDVAKVAREVLGGEEGSPATSSPSTPTPPTQPTDTSAATPTAAPAPSAAPPAEPLIPASTSVPGTTNGASTAAAPAVAQTTDNPAVKSADDPASPANSTTDDQKPASDEAVKPTPAPAPGGSTQIDPALAATLQAEEAAVGAQIDQFASAEAQPPAETAKPTPAIQIDVKDELEEPKQPLESADPTKPATISNPDSKLASAVDEIVKKDEPEAPAPQADKNDADSENVPIAHKKVIEPINDLTQTAPNLSELLAKEDQKEAISPVAQPEPSLPAQSVVQPAPASNSADSAENSTEQHKPGNVITPGGGTISAPAAGSEQPSDIAL